MHYTFELTFTGLCVFTCCGEDPWHPEEMNALLVDTTPEKEDEHCGHHHHAPHRPLLSVSPRDVDNNPVLRDFQLVPTPDGSQVAIRDLRRQHIRICPPENFESRLSVNWCPHEYGPRVPEGLGQEDWMDWATPLSRMYPCLGDPEPDMPYAGLNELAVTTVVNMRHGELIGSEFPRFEETDRYAPWEFKEIGGEDESKAPGHETAKEERAENHVQALAGVLTLRLTDLDPDKDLVTIESDAGWSLKLKPPSMRALVRVSISNLLSQEPSVPKNYLEHYLMLKRLVRWHPDHGEPKIPTKPGGPVTTTNTFCPPVRHFQG